MLDFNVRSELLIEELDRRKTPPDNDNNGDNNDNDENNEGKDAAKTLWAYL